MAIKILLADDSLTIQKVVELTFSNAETQLMAVGSGDKAVQALDEFQPDIVLADVVMPGLSGYDVCEQAKKRIGGAFVPVVLLTGTFEPFDRSRAERVGCDAIVTKPFDSHALQGLVNELAAKGRIAREQAATAPIPTAGFAAASPVAPVAPPFPVDLGATAVLTPLEIEEAVPEPFAEAAAAAPAQESIYRTMAMRVPTFDEPGEAPGMAREDFLAPEPAPARAPEPAFPPPPQDAPAVFETAPEARPESSAPFELDAFETEPPPPPPYFGTEPVVAPPPPPPPFFASAPEVPPPPAFFEAEPEVLPPPEPSFAPEPVAPVEPPPPPAFFVAEDEVPTGPVTPFVPDKVGEVLPFAGDGAAEPLVPPVAEPATPFALSVEPAPAEAVDEVEVEVEAERAESAYAEAPPAEEAAFAFVAEGPEAAPEAGRVGEESVEPFPEMDEPAPAAAEAEAAPWDEGLVSENPPPPPEMGGGPGEGEGEGIEPITRDLEADLAAFESSGRVRRRPEVWERHAALIGEEVPADVDLPGTRPEEPLAPAVSEPLPHELEEIAAAARLEDLSKLIPSTPAVALGAAAAAAAGSAVTTAPVGVPAAFALSDADVDRIARRVVQLLSDKAVRDIAWEVVPEYAERLVRERIAEVEKAG